MTTTYNWGVGLGYSFTRHIAVNADYTVYGDLHNNRGGHVPSLWQLGLSYSF